MSRCTCLPGQINIHLDTQHMQDIQGLGYYVRTLSLITRGTPAPPPITLVLGMHPAKDLGWYMWAHISTHLTLQLKDFSLMLLPQTMSCDLQVDQLLGDLWVAGVRGGTCEILWVPPPPLVPQGPYTHLQPLLLT